MGKELLHEFEDELGELVDEFLVAGVDPEELRKVLLSELENDHAARLVELQQKEEKLLQQKEKK